MTTQSEAVELLSYIALVHPRTAARVDDPQVLMGTAKIWAGMFSRHNLELPLLQEAVDKRAETNADAPEAAELIAVAREIRRDRAERESYEKLTQRWEETDRRMALAIESVGKPIPEADEPPKRVFTRPSQRADGRPNPLAIRCPWCHAAEHRPCRIPNVHGEKSVTLREPHPSRVEAAEAIARKLNGGAA